MKKFKLFIENILIYGLGGVISKLVPLIMVPIVTRIMPDSMYFGLSDMSNTLVSFASALAIMGMYDAMYRMFFEKEDEIYKQRVCSTAFLFTVSTSIVIFLVMLLCKDILAQFFFGDKKYAYLVYISAIATLVGATNSIVCAPTRMENKRKIFLITNTITPILSYGIAIPLLLNGHYVIALPVAGLVAAVTMEVTFWVLNHKWFDVHKFETKLLKQLLVIALPLLPNFLIYWVFNSSDKLMITNLLGVGEAGVYSVGAKLGTASQLIYTAFAGGWQYFAFSTMKEEDQVKSNSMIFEYLGVISFIASAFIFAFSSLLFRILFTQEYYHGYIISPYLFLAPLLQMLFQVAANQFIVVKKTWPNALILSLGAVSNVILNLLLIPIIGIEGAAIATLFGYVISDIICVAVLVKMKLMVMSRRFIVSVVLMICYIVVWRFYLYENVIVATLFATLLTVMNLFLFKQDILNLLNGLQKKDNS